MLSVYVRTKNLAQGMSPIDGPGRIGASLRSIILFPGKAQWLHAGGAPLILLLLQLGVSIFTMYVVTEPFEETDRVRVRRLSILKRAKQPYLQRTKQPDGMEPILRFDIIRVAASYVAGVDTLIDVEPLLIVCRVACPPMNLRHSFAFPCQHWQWFQGRSDD